MVEEDAQFEIFRPETPLLDNTNIKPPPPYKPFFLTLLTSSSQPYL